jgi:GxxExxY protein
VTQEDEKTGRFEDGPREVIAACIEVHRHVGPGLLESVYEQCLAHELALRGFRVERQRVLPVIYKGVRLGDGHRLDIVVDDWLIIEVKAVERLLPVHEAQVSTYLKLTGLDMACLSTSTSPVSGTDCDDSRTDIQNPSFPPSGG